MRLGSLRCTVLVLFAGGCATTPKRMPDHSTSGGALEGIRRLPAGPWAVDTLSVTDSCGAGAGLLLTQVLRERGYRIVSTGSSTRAEIECDWSSESVPVWEIDTSRAKADCVAEGVSTLSVSLKVLHKAYDREGEAEGMLANAEFRGRARVDAEPPHRGCMVHKEEDQSLLARGLRSVAVRIPEGVQKAPPLVAPAPAGADVAVGQAGPPKETTTAKSIYPVDFGDVPAPHEAVTIRATPGRSLAAKAADEKMPSAAVRDEEGNDLVSGPLITRRSASNGVWRRFELQVQAMTAACTDFCKELYSGGYGPGLRLMFVAHDLLALELGWRRIGMSTRDRLKLPADVETVLTDVDVGGRVYVGAPGGVRAFGGLGVAFTDLGDEWTGEGQTEGTRFSGFATRLLVGGEARVFDWLRAGLSVRYDRVGWDEVCERAGACEDVGEFHPIGGSDIWSAGAEISLALP